LVWRTAWVQKGTEVRITAWHKGGPPLGVCTNSEFTTLVYGLPPHAPIGPWHAQRPSRAVQQLAQAASFSASPLRLHNFTRERTRRLGVSEIGINFFYGSRNPRERTGGLVCTVCGVDPVRRDAGTERGNYERLSGMASELGAHKLLFARRFVTVPA